MIKYGIDNIRELFGPRVNLQMVYDNPLCRLERAWVSRPGIASADYNGTTLPPCVITKKVLLGRTHVISKVLSPLDLIFWLTNYDGFYLIT